MSAGEFDVIVIGGGIAGSSVAAHLAKNRRVLVLERESQPGYHSTGRSAALFSLIYGAEPVRALSRASREFLFDPPAGFSDTSLVRPRGALHIATAAQRSTLDAFAALPDVAPFTERLSSETTCELCPVLRRDQVDAAAFEPDAADVEVHALHHGYLRLLRTRGGLLLTDRPVEVLTSEGGVWRVLAGGESYTAPVVINAAGAWADVVAGLAGVAPLGLQPMRRTALLVDAPEGMQVDPWPMVIDIDEQFYFKPDAGLLLLSPADETPMEPCDVQPDEWDIALAIDRIEAVSSLKVRRVKHRWAGLRSFVSDRVPVAGYDPDAPGFFWLAGQGGYGIQTAEGLARTAAALVLQETLPEPLLEAGVDAADLSPARLRNAAPPRAGAVGHSS